MRSCASIAVASAFFAAAAAIAARSDEPTAAQPPRAVPQAIAQEQIALWVRQLGDDSFLLREDATRVLIAAGDAAEAAVQAALETHDPEVRYRALKILREIERGQLAQRRAAFLEGDTEQMRTNAASWKRLEQIVGNTRQSRELFLAMQQDAEELLNELEQDPQRCAARITQLHKHDALARRYGKDISPGILYAMVFAAQDEAITLDAAAICRCASFVTRRRAEANLEKNDAFRRLLGRWVARDTSISAQYQMLRLARQFQLDEARDVARKIIQGPMHPSMKSQVVMMLAQMGGPEDVAVLEKHIDDETRLGGMDKCRFGDVALAMCLVLSEQKLADYGFKNPPEGRPAALNYSLYTFDTDDARRAARQKWSEYRQAQTAESK